MNIKVKGSAYEQGYIQGKSAKELIQFNVDTFKKKIADSGVNLERYHELEENQFKYLNLCEPDLIDEMRGIADSSGIPFEDILIINIPLYFQLPSIAQECSMFLARGKATLDGKTYLVKNRDMRDEMKHVVIERIENNGRMIIEVNGAGIVTFPGNGMNSDGFMVATTGVWPRMIIPDYSELNSSMYLLNTSLILKNCSTIDETIEYLEGTKRMNGMNFIVADKTGAAAIEVTKSKVRVKRDFDDMIARTNHYKMKELVSLNPTVDEYPSTHIRISRIEELLREKSGNIRFQEMLQIASDHANGPEHCVCRHGIGNDGITVYTSIMVLEDQQVWTTLMKPCEAVVLTEME